MRSPKPKKLTPADKLEQNIRLLGLEAQISTVVNDIQNIELNAAWCATVVGGAAHMTDHGYSKKDLKKVLEKQEANRLRLRAKADLLKSIYNERINT